MPVTYAKCVEMGLGCQLSEEAFGKVRSKIAKLSGLFTGQGSIQEMVRFQVKGQVN